MNYSNEIIRVMHNRIKNNFIFINEKYEQCQYLPIRETDVIKNHVFEK